jgi:hypothetical protein
VKNAVGETERAAWVGGWKEKKEERGERREMIVHDQVGGTKDFWKNVIHIGRA